MRATKIVINGEEVEIGGVYDALQQKSNLNRLKNWYFVDPINQWGVSGVISAQGYFIDCWMLVSGTVELTSSGLVLDGEIQQKLENSVGEDTVATVLSTTGLMEAEYDDTLKILSISANGETLIAAKLEPGDQQTLARQDEDGSWVLNDPPPNYALELLKCQRCFNRIDTVVGVANGTPYVPIYVHYPEMRIAPTVTVKGEVQGASGVKIPDILVESTDFTKNSGRTVKLSKAYTGPIYFNDIWLDADP